MDYDINVYEHDDELIRRPKVIRRRLNFFEELDGTDFFHRFRLSPQTVAELLEEVEDVLTYPTNRNDCLSASQQLLLTLRFYASGSFLITTGDFCGVSKTTVHKTVRRVSRVLAQLRPRYIKMPQEEEDLLNIRQGFFQIARFPRCIGAIDCTHVRIQGPGGNMGEVYKNRKSFFSLNVQSICDANLKFQDIVSRWPGSTHDAHIFRNSNICALFEAGQFGQNLLVGDSEYPVKRYLMTPVQNPQNEAENLFNESLIRTRNTVERQYGVWKRRFPALATGLRLNLDTVQAVIVATAILHNIACDSNEAVPPVNEEQEAAINILIEPGVVENRRNGLNNFIRNNLIYNYFGNL